MHIALCILTRSERPSVEVIFPRILLPSLANGFDSIAVADGGSTDGTVEYFNERGIPVYGQSRRGRGEAFQIAFEQIEADAYIFFARWERRYERPQ
jgi:glycosyltransferase involved in cell wall biosynthesis